MVIKIIKKQRFFKEMSYISYYFVVFKTERLSRQYLLKLLHF